MTLELICLAAFVGYGFAAYKHGRAVERDLWVRRRDDIVAQWGEWSKSRFRRTSKSIDVIESKE